MRLCSVTLFALLLAAAAGAAPAGEGPDLEAIRAKLSAAECDGLAGQTARAELVCVAEAVKVREAGVADCRVLAVLKGELKAKTVQVRFSRLPGGAWPQPGERAIYFLKSTGAGAAKGTPAYQFVSDRGGLVAPTAEREALVRLAAAGRYVRVAQPAPPQVEPPAPESLEGMALDAAYVALGTIQEVSIPDAKSEAAEGSAALDFRVERVLKGDLKPGQVFVYVPAPRPELAGPERKTLAPKAGTAALFFRRERQGGAYRLLSPYRGYVAAAAPGGAKELGEQLAAAVETEKRLRREGLVGNPGGHDSVRDTIKTWQEAWNTKVEIEACVACYSRRSPWRQKWESGPMARQEMTETMAGYPATINVVCDRVEEKDPDRAAATVRMQVIARDAASGADYMEVRPAVMTLVHENGQWLILDEGN